MNDLNSEQATYPPEINFVREGVKIGLANGAFALLLMYGSYFMGINTFVDVQFYSIFLPYMIIVLIVYGFQLRKRNGGYLAFKQAIQFTFMSYVIVSLVVAAGTYVLYNLIDKNLTQRSFDVSIEKMKRIFENLGVPDEQIDKEIGSRQPQSTDFGTIFLGTGIDLIWHFVKSLLISLIIRKEKPAF